MGCRLSGLWLGDRMGVNGRNLPQVSQWEALRVLGVYGQPITLQMEDQRGMSDCSTQTERPWEALRSRGTSRSTSSQPHTCTDRTHCSHMTLSTDHYLPTISQDMEALDRLTYRDPKMASSTSKGQRCLIGCCNTNLEEPTPFRNQTEDSPFGHQLLLHELDSGLGCTDGSFHQGELSGMETEEEEGAVEECTSRAGSSSSESFISSELSDSGFYSVGPGEFRRFQRLLEKKIRLYRSRMVPRRDSGSRERRMSQRSRRELESIPETLTFQPVECYQAQGTSCRCPTRGTSTQTRPESPKLSPHTDPLVYPLAIPSTCNTASCQQRTHMHQHASRGGLRRSSTLHRCPPHLTDRRRASHPTSGSFCSATLRPCRWLSTDLSQGTSVSHTNPLQHEDSRRAYLTQSNPMQQVEDQRGYLPQSSPHQRDEARRGYLPQSSPHQRDDDRQGYLPQGSPHQRDEDQRGYLPKSSPHHRDDDRRGYLPQGSPHQRDDDRRGYLPQGSLQRDDDRWRYLPQSSSLQPDDDRRGYLPQGSPHQRDDDRRGYLPQGSPHLRDDDRHGYLSQGVPLQREEDRPGYLPNVFCASKGSQPSSIEGTARGTSRPRPDRQHWFHTLGHSQDIHDTWPKSTSRCSVRAGLYSTLDSHAPRAPKTMTGNPRTQRNQLLRQRASRLADERGGVTTDEETCSEAKMGRYWSRTERRHQLHLAKEQRLQALARSGPVGGPGSRGLRPNTLLELSHRKLSRLRNRNLLDDWTTVEELLTHGTRLGSREGVPCPSSLLSVTTV